MSKLDWKMGDIVWLRPDKIIPYVNNNKEHPDTQIERIMLQITKYGFDQPLVIDEDHIIIKGHGRHIAGTKLDIDLPCLIREGLSEEDKMALRIADNAVARSDWNEDNLKFELGTLQRAEYNLELTGLEEKEIAKYLEEDDVKISSDGINVEENKQFVVSVNCEDEDKMAELYQELKDRGYECSLIM